MTYAKCKRRCGAPANGDVNHTVSSGESLSLIAGRYYKDVLLWPIIYEANVGTVGNNPNLIKPNQPLVIPDIKRFTQAELDRARSRGRKAA